MYSCGLLLRYPTWVIFVAQQHRCTVEVVQLLARPLMRMYFLLQCPSNECSLLYFPGFQKNQIHTIFGSSSQRINTFELKKYSGNKWEAFLLAAPILVFSWLCLCLAQRGNRYRTQACTTMAFFAVSYFLVQKHF